LFLQFLDLYGNPVYLRPERVDALRGIAVTHEGSLRAGTMVLMANRETFRLRGHVDTISAAISEWHGQNAPKIGDASASQETGKDWLEIAEARHDAMALRLPVGWGERIADQAVSPPLPPAGTDTPRL
jgi:hypothetical protein